MEPTRSNDHRVNVGQVDIISQLPDHILEIILHKLMESETSSAKQGTREVVKTMLLSKRWNKLWASLPHLSFYNDEESFPNMVTFINRVLLSRDSSNILSFRLVWYEDVGDVDDLTRDQNLSLWTDHVVKRNVKILHLYVDSGIKGPMEFPRCIFTSQTLEELVLKVNYIGANLTTCVHLVRLRKLQLYNFFLDQAKLKQLISGCPVLQDLELDNGFLVDPEISSNSLTKLKIHMMLEIRGSLFKISCPNIRSFTLDYSDINMPDILLENVSSLVKATIQIDRYCNYLENEEDSKDPIEFVTSRNQYGSRAGFPTFTNLKRLELNGRQILRNFNTVERFVDASPNLKLLRIEDIGNESNPYRDELTYKCPHFTMGVIYGSGKLNKKRVDQLVKLIFVNFVKCDCQCWLEDDNAYSLE